MACVRPERCCGLREAREGDSRMIPSPTCSECDMFKCLKYSGPTADAAASAPLGDINAEEGVRSRSCESRGVEAKGQGNMAIPECTEP